MDNQQVPMFKEWFIDTYPECKDYLDLTYFDVEKNTFIAKCSYNPDSGNAAKVLRIALGSWQHQQAKVEEANAKAQMCRDEKNHAINRWSAVCKERDELQKRVEGLEDRLKATDTLSKMRAAVIGSFNTQEFNARTKRKMLLLKKSEQALKGEG
ncbi:hypothetical protein V8P95_04900 [Acinetobacter baumannii]